MIDPKKLEEIAKQIHNALPPGIRSMGEEVEKKTRQVLQAQLNKLDLVSREEFEAVKTMAAEARAELEVIRAELDALRAQSAAGTSTTAQPARASRTKAQKIDIS